MRKQNGPAADDAADRAGVIVRRQRTSRSTSQTPLTNLSDVRFARSVVKLHKLGPRIFFELLAELGRTKLIRVQLETLVENYVERLRPEILVAIGADDFPAIVRLVQREYPGELRQTGDEPGPEAMS
jgi:hypothetical protein